MMTDLEVTPVSVSFVLPAYNEGKVIETVLARLENSVSQSSQFGYEVVVVDDGSEDDTRLRAWRYAARNWRVRVLSYRQNVGKGFAVRIGFWSARGDAVIFADSDTAIDFGQIERYVDALRHGDIVIGSKWHKDSVVQIPAMRKFLGHGFNALVKLLTGIRVSDTQTGIKAVRRETFDKVFRCMTVKRYAFDVELLAVAKLFGLKVVELPVCLKISKGFKLREIWHMLLDLLGIAYRLKIKRWYQNGAS